MHLRFLALTLFALLSGCAALQPGCASLPEGVSYCLQPTASAPRFEVRQKVIASINGKRSRALLDIDNSPEASHLAVLSLFGHELLLAAYDNRDATAQRSPHAQLTAERAMALMQMVYWPAEAVQRGLNDGTRLEDDGRLRRILRDDKVLFEMERDASPSPHRTLKLLLPAYAVELELSTTAEENAKP